MTYNNLTHAALYQLYTAHTYYASLHYYILLILVLLRYLTSGWWIEEGVAQNTIIHFIKII